MEPQPLQEEELDAFVKIYWSAFEPIEADMIMPMIYPSLTAPLIERLKARVLRATAGDLASSCFCIRDGATGTLLGVSWWRHVQKGPESKDEIDAAFEAASSARRSEIRVEGMNEAMENAAFRAVFYAEAQTMQPYMGQPYLELRLLAVDPDHLRQGIGTQLLNHGLSKADAADLPVYLAAGHQGRPLYERYGFRVVGELPFNALDYGGRSRGTHWCMTRPPKSAR